MSEGKQFIIVWQIQLHNKPLTRKRITKELGHVEAETNLTLLTDRIIHQNTFQKRK